MTKATAAELSLASHVAFLRGINVGGKNRVDMKRLAGIFADCGCLQIRTYIQSGNVVFDADANVLSELPAKVSAEIARQYGYRTPVVLRSGKQLRDVAAKNPFAGEGIEPSFLHVYFLAAAPDKEAINRLESGRFLPDRFHVRQQEIYLHLPNGMGRSKLTNAYFDSKLNTVSTARNWRTVCTLLEWMKG